MSTVQSLMTNAAIGKFEDVEVLKQIDKIRCVALILEKLHVLMLVSLV